MFAAQMASNDRLILCDPAYFGGTTDRSVTSADIVHDLAVQGVGAEYIADRRAAGDHLLAMARPGDRIVVMGARDDTLSQFAAELVAKLAAGR
jgi:UDP-N-acetylmuramate--alanine ligase